MLPTKNASRPEALVFDTASRSGSDALGGPLRAPVMSAAQAQIHLPMVILPTLQAVEMQRQSLWICPPLPLLPQHTCPSLAY